MEVVVIEVDGKSISFEDMDQQKEVQVKGKVSMMFFKDGYVNKMSNDAHRFNEIKDTLTEDQLELINHIED